jgi:hypothetical protein
MILPSSFEEIRFCIIFKEMNNMPENKYQNLFKTLTFKDEGPGSFSQGVEMGKSNHGLNVHIHYGTYGRTGPMGGKFGGLHTHDFDQLCLWVGSDMNNLLELGAEIEVYLGEEFERYMITTPTALVIPKGVPHFPATIKSMDKKFQYMEISLAPDFSANLIPTKINPADVPSVSGFKSKYFYHVRRLLFMHKGPFFYGANNREDSGGDFTSIIAGEEDFPLHLTLESMKAFPYTFGPAPHAPHVHKFEEILLLMGADCDNLAYLGADCQCSMGKEKEVTKFNKPTAIICPEMFPHCPMSVTKIDKPFYFMVVSCAAEHHPSPKKKA